MKKKDFLTLKIVLPDLSGEKQWLEKNAHYLIIALMAVLSVFFFIYFWQNGLGLAYNDARSHLNIGRRVVEGLKPGLAQIGSVWLPLPHLLMIPTVWSEFMWHSGLSGSIQSMLSFVLMGYLIYAILKDLDVGLPGRFFGVVIFIFNINILYLQSIAMTELLLLMTMTAGVCDLMRAFRDDNFIRLIRSALFIMMATLIRYEGWFLLLAAAVMIFFLTLRISGYKKAEGTLILFSTLGFAGIIAWFLWNQLIFKDILYFIFGPFSARSQQLQLESAGNLTTKGDWFYSAFVYLLALLYNSGTFIAFLGLLGMVLFWFDIKIKPAVRLALTALITPLIFNVLALYLGHSVLFIQGISGESWFNARYGIMLMPAIAVFAGYFFDRIKPLRWTVFGLTFFTIFFTLINRDAVTIDDATVGASQKNVSQVSRWLNENAANQKGFIMISVASHDAVIFSSKLPMKRFIHEGTGEYWDRAGKNPDLWARWIVMRTNDDNDLTFMAVKKSHGIKRYELVGSYPFADIYELKKEYLAGLITKPVKTSAPVKRYTLGEFISFLGDNTVKKLREISGSGKNQS